MLYTSLNTLYELSTLKPIRAELKYILHLLGLCVQAYSMGDTTLGRKHFPILLQAVKDLNLYRTL